MLHPCLRNAPRSQPRTAFRLAFALVCAAALGGCRDDSATVAPVATTPSAAIAVLESGDLMDPGIDPGDSHLVTTSVTRTTATIESAEPFVDPLTGQEVTRLELPDVIDSTRFEAGYDAAGTVRLNEYHSGNDSGGTAARVQIVGNVATFYDVFGATVHDTSGPILMDALGPMDNVIVTNEAVLLADEPSPVANGEMAAARESDIAGEQSRVREEQRGDRLYRTYSLDDPASDTRGERTRQYRRSGNHWVLVEERAQTIQPAGKLAFTVVQATVYPVVKWKNNEGKDARRREKDAEQSDGRSVAAQRTIFAASRAPARLSAVASRQSDPDVGAGSGAEMTCLLCPDVGAGDGVSGGVTSSSGLNIVFQHGAFADAGSWYRMDPWISARYAINRKVKPSLNWRAGLESQATTLNGQMLATSGSGYLMIGHSNGGLISRRVGQMETQSGGPLVSGVIAIASPHLGLPLAKNSRTTVTNQLSAYLNSVLVLIGGSCWRKEFEWVCGRVNDALLTLVPRIVNFAFDAAAPVSSDVRPGSVYLAQLNTRNEAFLKYSVEVHSQGAWKFLRMLGDWVCEPEDRCSGNHLQNSMESIYDVLRICGSNEIARLIRPGVAEKCNNVRWSLSTLNLAYERLTSPNDASDGLVPAKSQQYPGVAEGDRALMRNAKESHAGELKSGTVRTNLFYLMDRYRIQPT